MVAIQGIVLALPDSTEQIALFGYWKQGKIMKTSVLCVSAAIAVSLMATTAEAQPRSARKFANVEASQRFNAGPRPSRWCGWWMRTQMGGGPELNVAWNWRNWGSPTSAQVGAVVVWRHHVGIITGQTSSGRWIVKSGNDGGRVRERARSVSGAVFRM